MGCAPLEEMDSENLPLTPKIQTYFASFSKHRALLTNAIKTQLTSGSVYPDRDVESLWSVLIFLWNAFF